MGLFAKILRSTKNNFEYEHCMLERYLIPLMIASEEKYENQIILDPFHGSTFSLINSH